MNTLTEQRIKINQQTGSDILVQTLIENGVDVIFGYPGSPILSIYNSLSKTDKIKHYLSRHEQGAVHAAEGYARVSKKCGVVLVTSGPGFTNTITGIMNANTDKTPLLIITVQSEHVGQNEFQDIDVNEITKPCTKKTFIVSNPDDIQKTINNAIKETTRLPMGTVVVALTKKTLVSETNIQEIRKRHEIKVEAPHSCILRTIDNLKNANKPLIIIGGGCKNSEEEIRELAHLTNIPIVNTLMGSGIYDNYSIGMIGINGNQILNETIKEADVVLSLGTRFSDRTTGYDRFLPNSKIFNINIEQNTSSNVTITEEILGELKVVLQQMIGVIKAKNIKFDLKFNWIDTISKTTEQLYDLSTFNMETVISEIYNYTKKYNPIITTDVGEHQIAAAKIFKTNSASNFLTSGGFGTMGYGLPAAIGAQIANPNSLVMNISGDGSFQMNIQELGMCSQYNLPIKIFLINNSSLGMIKTQQIENSYNVYQSNIINPDFSKIAEGYGITSYKINSVQDLQKALVEIFIYRKAVLLDIKVDS